MPISSISPRGLVFTFTLLAAALAPAADLATTTQRVQAHTTFLADDLLEGRGTGTRGYDLAARYVASQFARLGLEPGADGGQYLQPMKFREATHQIEAGRLVVRHNGAEDALTPINDMVVTAGFSRTADTITAPAVFVGYGVHAPELGYDDYAGVDLTGKIAVVLSGAPKQFPSTQRAHHSSSSQKRELAEQHGAIGMVAIMTPADEARYPWAVVTAQSRFPSMRLLDAAGNPVNDFPALRVSGTTSRAAAARLFVGSGRTTEEVFARAEADEAQNFPLNVELTLAGANTQREVVSANVLGWLPGTDPALADQPLVVTGHLDHLGIGTAINGDSIYNGAIDNAVGIALILAAAEEIAAGPRPARPVLFAALTGEEKGLLGAFHLAANPPARVRRFAANLNVDMPLFPVPVRSLIAWGAEHTTLGALAATRATQAGFTVTPDPMPAETIFVRSDQYAFVKIGVPALYLSSGQQAVDPAVDLAGLWRKHLQERYHKPSDDLNQPIDWPSAGAFGLLVADLMRDIANAPQAPAWLPGDFFGGLYGTKK
ncbi:Peptidase family M28 [Lacunisphaera limnophila]|uniref:Peptidase family M28 n=1 Tax=Lacunisphaera limnophila TaxID=1838286 RepID=A0A1D8ARL5_9BACT|nr:M28 family metallopeptidase [Lacunisphaera limnophila]AOS43541.1 Peptidase family M28 [Lacunisphaera limnophila]